MPRYEDEHHADVKLQERLEWHCRMLKGAMTAQSLPESRIVDCVKARLTSPAPLPSPFSLLRLFEPLPGTARHGTVLAR